MKTVLVLGGYGGFGTRLSRRLSASGWSVLVAGRNFAAASRLAASLPNARPVVADRRVDLRPILKENRPFLLIDAAGPFQESGYDVAMACVDSGVNYLDLADARAFVAGIGSLDARARRAGVVVVSGGSSLPALSGAVIADLSSDMDAVNSVEMAISASNRAAAGPSVAAAILSYVGKPLRIWSAGRWQLGTGWHMLRRAVIEVPGKKPIRKLVALADVPDHEIVPASLLGRPSTTFRAGPELATQVVVLWLLSWLVKWRLLRSLSFLSRGLLPMQKLTAGLGSDRSGMLVEVKGRKDQDGVVKTWSLIAEDGDGPEIPTMAAQILAAAIRDGALPPGARHAGRLLSVDDFTPLFNSLAIAHHCRTRVYAPLYRQIVGEAYDCLPIPVKEIHDVIGSHGAAGRGFVRRGRSVCARLICAAMRFPEEGEHDLHVSFQERDGVERWTRDFSGRKFSSELSHSGDGLVERFGPMRFQFNLSVDNAGLRMHMRSWSVFGVPMPLRLAPRSEAHEWAEREEFCFDVPIALPFVGEIIHYSGSLRRVP